MSVNCRVLVPLIPDLNSEVRLELRMIESLQMGQFSRLVQFRVELSRVDGWVATVVFNDIGHVQKVLAGTIE